MQGPQGPKGQRGEDATGRGLPGPKGEKGDIGELGDKGSRVSCDWRKPSNCDTIIIHANKYCREETATCSQRCFNLPWIQYTIVVMTNHSCLQYRCSSSFLLCTEPCACQCFIKHVQLTLSKTFQDISHISNKTIETQLRWCIYWVSGFNQTGESIYLFTDLQGLWAKHVLVWPFQLLSPYYCCLNNKRECSDNLPVNDLLPREFLDWKEI